jgi:hypothetical protein
MADMNDQCSGNNNVEVLPMGYKGLIHMDNVSNVFLYDEI